ncbi:MAG: hypothetical protein ACNA8W_07970 [Bradymonadaceae bacterium]
MSEFVAHSSFIRPIVIEVEGTHVEGVVTQMLPWCVEVSLVAPREGLYVQSVFDPVVDGSRRGCIERLRDETLPQRMLFELWRVAELFDERLEGLRLSFLALEETRRRAWRAVGELDTGRLDELLGTRASNSIHGMILHRERQEEARYVFRRVRAIQYEVRDARVAAFGEHLAELGEMEFVRAVEEWELTAFGVLLWRRIALAANRRGPTWTT